MHDDKLDGSALIKRVVRDDPTDVVAGIVARSGWDADRSRKFLASHLPEFERQVAIAEATGDLHEAMARRLDMRILRRIDAELDSLDLMEAASLLKYTQRELERADRLRATEHDKKERPVFHITIFGREAGSSPTPNTDDGVIDADTFEITPVVSAPTPLLTADKPNPLAFLDALKGATPIHPNEGDGA